MKVAIYARVSTNAQDYNRQVSELREYASRMGYEIVKEFTEKISGARVISERKALSCLLEFVKSTRIDKILVYECSRLSRKAVDFLSIIEILSSWGVSVYIHLNGIETLTPEGKVNPVASMLLGILAQFNSVERDLIRDRMRSGYDNYRRNGGSVGRKIGYRKSDEQIRAEYAEEIRLLKKGYSLRNIQRITHTSVNTLRKIAVTVK